MRTTAVAAGAIICSAVAAVPFVCGQILEREIREAMDGYKKRQSFVTASVVSYDRHFLRSEFVTRLAVRGGPSSFARPRACVTRLSPACTLPPAKATCISRKPMRQPSTTTSAAGHRLPSTSMSSSAAARAASCALPPSRSLIASPSTRVVAGASSGRFNIAKDKAFQFEWTLPKGAYEDPKLSMAVDGLAMSAYGQLGDDDLSERSVFKLSFASYRGVQGSQNISVRDFSVSTQMMPSTDTLRVALAVRMGAGEVVLDAGPYVWESFELACSLSDVQKAPVVRYSAELRKLSDVDASESQRMLLAMRAVSELAAGLAGGEPVFAVDKLEMRTPQGNVAGSLRVSVDKARMAIGASSWTAADGFVMSGRASISRSLAARLLAATTGGEPAAQSMIALLASRGVLREEGDALAFDIAARDGVYMVNGVRASGLARMYRAMVPRSILRACDALPESR